MAWLFHKYPNAAELNFDTTDWKNADDELFQCEFIWMVLLRGNKFCRLLGSKYTAGCKYSVTKLLLCSGIVQWLVELIHQTLVNTESLSQTRCVPSVLQSKCDTSFFPKSFLFKGEGFTVEQMMHLSASYSWNLYRKCCKDINIMAVQYYGSLERLLETC